MAASEYKLDGYMSTGNYISKPILALQNQFIATD